MLLHIPIWDKIAELENKLREALHDSGYRVLNVVYSNKGYGKDIWDEMRRRFPNTFGDSKRKVRNGLRQCVLANPAPAGPGSTRFASRAAIRVSAIR